MSLGDKSLIKLRDQLWAAMVSDYTGESESIDPLTMWQPLYADAIAAVLTRAAPTDWARLSALLREKQPLHPMLLPALADALEARGRPKRVGRQRKLSPIEQQQAARDVLSLRRAVSSQERAIADVAQRLGVSESTVQRAVRIHNRRHL